MTMPSAQHRSQTVDVPQSGALSDRRTPHSATPDAPPAADATGSASMPVVGAIPVPARSSLRQAGGAAVGRRRPYERRAALLLALFAVVGGVIAAVPGQWFEPAGLGRALYRLHDALVLPIYAQVWLAPFPGGLVWAVPAVAIAALIVVEFSGLARPMRRSQVWLLDRLLGHGFGDVLVWTDRFLRRFGLRAGLAAALVDERLADARATALERMGTHGSVPPMLIALARLRVLLDPDTVSDRLLLSEIMALADLSGPEDYARAAAVLAPLLAAMGAREPQPSGPMDPRAGSAWPGETGASAETLAQQTLDVVLGIVRHRRPEALIWFDAWARAWVDPATPIAARYAMTEAETLIAFEAWAALAERMATGPVAAGLLAEAFEEARGPRSRGEVFARDGGTEPKPEHKP